MLTSEEIKTHVFNQLLWYALLAENEMNFKEAEEFAQRHLVDTLCAYLSSALLCAELTIDMLPEEIQSRAERQIYNWGGL